MAAKKLDRKCAIAGCGRKHAAHGYCLMHYKREAKEGTPEYRWGGRVVGRACTHCDRPVVAKELCMRHYQMLRKHGDPLYADNAKVGGLPPGQAIRRGRYRTVSPVADFTKAKPITDPAHEKTDKGYGALNEKSHGFRDGSSRSRREWEHRKVAGAIKGDVVHHIDLNPGNNAPGNLHIFKSASAHTLSHRSLERVAASLVSSGVVVFNHLTGLYSLA